MKKFLTATLWPAVVLLSGDRKIAKGWGCSSGLELLATFGESPFDPQHWRLKGDVGNCHTRLLCCWGWSQQGVNLSIYVAPAGTVYSMCMCLRKGNSTSQRLIILSGHEQYSLQAEKKCHFFTLPCLICPIRGSKARSGELEK